MKKFESDTLEALELYTNRLKALLKLNVSILDSLTINETLSRDNHEKMTSLVESSLMFAELVESEIRYVNRAFLDADD